jgi:hypothetical protein
MAGIDFRGLTSGLLGAVALGMSGVAGDTFAADTTPAGPVFDMGMELTLLSDYMDSGLTNSDHDPAFNLKFTPSYGIFYGSLAANSIDYGTKDPKLQVKVAVGATPTFGDLSIDFNLERRIKTNDPDSDRWLPYVTGTYVFNDAVSASLGTGYYIFDSSANADFWEFYGGLTLTHSSGTTLLTEAYWEPNSDGDGNYYYGVASTLTVPFMEKWEASAKLGYEGYEDKASTAPYLWYEAGLNYKFNDHVILGAAYHGNNLSSAECGTQAYTDCDHAIFATLTLKGNLSDLGK